ncbi:MAG: DNA-binding protein [Cellvibrio sp.]|uniref:DNA-binding protein n=1 Tax=Cellvibrio sp. TaxID=1965322 RepID=UPI00272685BB|nr:DNA-binding protein [Cellvibrio sp.]
MKIEGVKPTSRAVRERLGNTGSMGTINKLLGRWKSGQERQISAALVLPPALQRVLLEFMDNELTAARTTLEAELADQQQEAADLATENERQVIENDAQAETIEQLRSEVAAHQGRAGQLETDLTASREEAVRERSGAELARTELAKAQLRLEAMPRLEADLVAVREVLETERLARQQAEQTAAVLTAKLEAAERRATEADARTTKAEAAITQSAEKAEIVARELVTANAKLEAAERRANEADTRTVRAEAATATAARDLVAATAIVQAGQARLESAARELEDAKKAVATANATAKKSGEDAAALRGQVETLQAQSMLQRPAAKTATAKKS